MNRRTITGTCIFAIPGLLAAFVLIRPTHAHCQGSMAHGTEIKAVAMTFSPDALNYDATPAAADNVSGGTEVKVDNFTFSPETITVPVNSSVTWVNKDDVPHVIASDSGVFKSKALDTDDKYSYTFTKAGTYSYFCSVHPKMVGKVIVQ
jgi:plastocyanin